MKTYPEIVAIGAFFVWLCAILFWIKVGGAWSAIGSLLITASCIAVFFYTNAVELELRKASDSLDEVSKEMNFWKHQAQVSLEMLEKQQPRQKQLDI